MNIDIERTNYSLVKANLKESDKKIILDYIDFCNIDDEFDLYSYFLITGENKFKPNVYIRFGFYYTTQFFIDMDKVFYIKEGKRINKKEIFNIMYSNLDFQKYIMNKRLSESLPEKEVIKKVKI